MTTTPYPPYSVATIPNYASMAGRHWAVGFWRCLIFCALFSIIFLPEFTRDGAPSSLLYFKAAAGFRYVDLAILVLVLLHLIALGCSRTKILHFPRELAIPGLAFLGCVAFAIAYGDSRGGSNFFFDWRGLALGIGLYFVWSLWISSPADVNSALRVFAVYMAIRIAFLYVLYLAGYRDTLLGVSIPIFDGPVLSAIVFTALLAFRNCEAVAGGMEKLLWWILAAAACLIVLLCFRRTYWGELGVGMAILLLRGQGHRWRRFLLVGATLCVAAGILGGSFSERILSLNVLRSDSSFAADNADHVLDLADAWDQVRQFPILGIGVGTSYPTWHIKNWKTESVMVHNAPLHVWLKYGLAGVVCYLWFHFALLRWLYRSSKGAATHCHRFASVAFAYLAAQFVMTLGFAPWPYSELQLTTLMSFLVVLAMVGDRRLRPLSLWS